MYVCILDAASEISMRQNIKTKPDVFLRAIEPYRNDVVVCTECMFSWYWLTDLFADEAEGAVKPIV